MAPIGRDESKTVSQSRRTDEDIVGTNDHAVLDEVGPDGGMDPGRFQGEGEDRKRIQNRTNETFSTFPSRGGFGSMNAMQELRGRNRRNRDWLATELLQKRTGLLRLAFDGDEKAGIDQEAQGASPMGG